MLVRFLNGLCYMFLYGYPVLIAEKLLNKDNKLITKTIISIFTFMAMFSTIENIDGFTFYYWLFLFPAMCILIYLIVKENKTYIQFTKKPVEESSEENVHIIPLSSVIITAVIFIALFAGLRVTNKMMDDEVIAYHHEVMNRLSESEDKYLQMMYEAENPVTLVEFKDEFDKIANADVHVLSSGRFKKKLTLSYDNKQLEFTYIRNRSEWKLDGVYDYTIRN